MVEDSEIAGVTVDRKKETKCYQCNNLFPTESILHCSIDGNDNVFCSESCIREYSRLHPKSVVTILDAPKGHPLAPLPKKYYDIAEKIVEGLLESGFLATKNEMGYWQVFFAKVPPPSKETLIKTIAESLLKNLTYGNLGTLTLRNNKGQIVAKLYILLDGTLADDSWICNEGWKK